MNNHIVHIDIAKGIAILLIAFGYIPDLPPVVLSIVYSFHLPLLFFLSGYFFNTSISFMELLKNQFHSLLKPYFVVTILVYFFYISFGKLDLITSLGRLVKSLYGAEKYVVWSPLWLLPHLFLVGIFCYWVIRFHQSILKNNYLYCFFLFGMLTAHILTINKFSTFTLKLAGHSVKLYGLPFGADLLLLNSFYFVLGEQAQSLISEKWLKNWLLLLSTGLLLIIGSIYAPVVYLEMNSRVYPSLLFSTIQAFVGIWFVLALSRQLELWGGRLANLLIYLGQISLMILIFHYPMETSWMPKLEEIIGLTWLAQLLAFLSGIIGPVLAYEIFIKQNGIAAWWFGIEQSEADIELEYG